MDIGIICSHDASVAFKDVDVAICIGSAREYTFDAQEYDELFFKEHVRIAKFYVLVFFSLELDVKILPTLL